MCMNSGRGSLANEAVGFKHQQEQRGGVGRGEKSGGHSSQATLRAL